MNRTAVQRLVDEFARHTDWCAAWCAGNDEHGAHKVAGVACTCGFDETVAQALQSSPDRDALEAIAGMKVDASTDHAQLSALCIAIARRAIGPVAATSARAPWTVECGACSTSYDQAQVPGASALGPVVCGACGSPRVKVTQHVLVFDRRAA